MGGVGLQLFYCDETNLEERAGDFLIYGGIVFDGANAKEFSSAVDDLRARLRVPDDYVLKFNPGPVNFSHTEFIALKQAVLELAVQHGARLVVYTILHDIAVSPDEARRNGINTVCYHFNCILNRMEQPGLVLIDRFNDVGNAVDAHLRDKFSVGVTGLPYTEHMRLTNIVGFHYSAIGQSHFPSIVDVALGSLRFAINAHTRNQHDMLPSAHSILQLLSPLFWRENNEHWVPELGFMFSPKSVRKPRYRETYESLQTFLAASGVPTSQRIVG